LKVIEKLRKKAVYGHRKGFENSLKWLYKVLERLRNPLKRLPNLFLNSLRNVRERAHERSRKDLEKPMKGPRKAFKKSQEKSLKSLTHEESSKIP
jgi:hypothetical protein